MKIISAKSQCFFFIKIYWDYEKKSVKIISSNEL